MRSEKSIHKARTEVKTCGDFDGVFLTFVNVRLGLAVKESWPTPHRRLNKVEVFRSAGTESRRVGLRHARDPIQVLILCGLTLTRRSDRYSKSTATLYINITALYLLYSKSTTLF